MLIMLEFGIWIQQQIWKTEASADSGLLPEFYLVYVIRSDDADVRNWGDEDHHQHLDFPCDHSLSPAFQDGSSHDRAPGS